ncbi:MAG: VOC family protein [Roseobacter sp.]
MTAQLEHANCTVTNADQTAKWMCALFGWHIRWQGPSLDGVESLHIGNDRQYLALYQPNQPVTEGSNSYKVKRGLNHIGVVVDDIHVVEQGVKSAGFTPENHQDYAPGQRFYFHDQDNIEYEIVQYD